MSNFCTPSPPFSVCPNGSELGETPPIPHPGRRNLRYQHPNPSPPPPPPSPLVLLQKIGMLKVKNKAKMLSKA